MNLRYISEKPFWREPLSNIHDETLWENSQWLLVINYHRRMTGFDIHLSIKRRANLISKTIIPSVSFLMQNKRFYSNPQTAICFLKQKTKFCSCTQTAIRFFYYFYYLIQNFTVASKRSFVYWPRNTKFEVVLKRPFVSWWQARKIELYYSLNF